MELKGLVSRRRCPEDRRQVLCYATPKGNGLVELLEPIVSSLGDRCFEQIPPTRVETFIETLELIRERAGRL
jgi:DNA-binding MarR family transcriptional regulator